MNELAERSANEEQLISNEDKTKPINEKKEEQIDTSVNKKEKVIEVKEKKKKEICKNTISKILYYFKDYLFLLALLVAPIPNYSYLTLFYVLMAILSCFFLIPKKRKHKKIKIIY